MPFTVEVMFLYKTKQRLHHITLRKNLDCTHNKTE